MGEQAVDLRSTVAVLRRRRRPLIAVAMAGVAAGVGSVLLWPPLYSSASLVLLPPVGENGSGQAAPRDVETVTRVAGSEAVLGPAGRSLTPPLSAEALAEEVRISAPTSDVVEIDARAATPKRAQEIATAVAKAEVTYVTESSSSLNAAQQAALANRKKDLQATLDKVNEEIKKTNARKQTENPASPQARADATALAQLSSQQANLALQIDQVRSAAAGVQPTAGASIIQGASPAKRPGLILRFVLSSLVGLACAVALAAALLTARARRDRTMRSRDEIADAVGSPVVASVRSHVPRTVAGWQSLLEDYEPGTVDAWALRQALRQLVPHEPVARPGGGGPVPAKARHPLSVTVLTLSDDLRGLAVGPQLAAYAAATGIRTRLVARQGHDAAAALWAACSAGDPDSQVRPRLFLSTTDGVRDDVELTVVLAVLDRRRPEVEELPETAAVILALSPGTATAEDLARAAVRADDADLRIAGVIVADPDELDRTTGRLLQHERSQQAPLPVRLTGMSATKPSPAGTSAAGGNAKRNTGGRSSTGRGSSGRASTPSSRRRPG
jgi:capsular polysaccharide biosynthesis protein